MIIYNVTIKVDWLIHDKWLDWMKQEHIPEMLASACFINHQMVRLLEVEEYDGPTYAIQYYANSKAEYKRWQEEVSKTVKQKSISRWGDKVVVFDTLMEVVN